MLACPAVGCHVQGLSHISGKQPDICSGATWTVKAALAAAEVASLVGHGCLCAAQVSQEIGGQLEFQMHCTPSAMTCSAFSRCYQNSPLKTGNVFVTVQPKTKFFFYGYQSEVIPCTHGSKQVKRKLAVQLAVMCRMCPLPYVLFCKVQMFI